MLINDEFFTGWVAQNLFVFYVLVNNVFFIKFYYKQLFADTKMKKNTRLKSDL